jgi:drug/metabolite transporter (DMT)-like permease
VIDGRSAFSIQHSALTPSPEKPRTSAPAYLALLAAISGIAWSAILVRWAGVPGPSSAFYRVLVAGIVLIPWRLARGGTRPIERRAAAIAVLGGVFFALDIALWNSAVMYTGAAVASILGNNTPVFVGILSWIVFRKRPHAAFWIGLSLSLAGCLAIMRPSSADPEHPITLYGNLLAVGGSAFFAAYLVTTQRVRQSMDTLTFNSLAIAGSIVTMLIVCLVLREPLAGFTPRTWTALVALGLVSQLAAYYALVYALGHLPATVTSVSLLAQVPSTGLLAWLLLGEHLTAAQIAGGAVVLVGIFVVNRGS